MFPYRLLYSVVMPVVLDMFRTYAKLAMISFDYLLLYLLFTEKQYWLLYCAIEDWHMCLLYWWVVIRRQLHHKNLWAWMKNFDRAPFAFARISCSDIFQNRGEWNTALNKSLWFMRCYSSSWTKFKITSPEWGETTELWWITTDFFYFAFS